MDINLSSKLIKYAPAEVQTVTYVVEYAEHNCWDVREIHEYIEAQLKSSRLIEIADILDVDVKELIESTKKNDQR